MTERKHLMKSGPSMHHVGIVQPSEEEAMTVMALLGLKEDYRGYVEKWRALCIFTKPEGATPIEFVIPNGGPLAKFNKGFGCLHHISLTLNSLVALTKRFYRHVIQFLHDV